MAAPLAWVSMPEATASVALVSTPANWFMASTSSFQENSYALGVAVPGMMSWNCPPITSVQALFRRSSGYGRPPSQLGGDGSLLGGIGQQLVLAVPPLQVGFGRDGAGGVVGQLQVALVARQPGRLVGLDVEEHLVGRGRDDVQRGVLGHDCFQQFDRSFGRGAADVAGAVVVIIGEQPAHLAVQLDSGGPVFAPRAGRVGTLAEVGGYGPL